MSHCQREKANIFSNPVGGVRLDRAAAAELIPGFVCVAEASESSGTERETDSTSLVRVTTSVGLVMCETRERERASERGQWK